MVYVLGILGIVASFYLIVKREMFGDMFGDPEWAHKIGGIYNVIVIVAIFIFFWSIAAMTGTMDVLFAPITSFLRMGMGGGGGGAGMIE